MGVLRVRDPADPTGATWLDVVSAGPPGATGAIGPTGVEGPVGPAGPPGNGSVYSHHFAGPVSSSYATWTVDLVAGSYIAEFAHSAVALANGLRHVNLLMDGVFAAQSKFYFNVINQHMMMNEGVYQLVIPTDGTYVFTLEVSGSLTIDGNDFGHATLTPGTVS